MASHSILNEVLQGLMQRYMQRVPDVQAISRTMIQAGIITNESDIENDHIAFRTMGVPHLGIQSLEKIFLHYGYERRDPYYFPAKKVRAFWYAPPSAAHPRIFISQLLVEELSAETQRIIRSFTDEIISDPVDSLDLDNSTAVDEFLHKPLWRTPTWPDYQTLAYESEFASWVIYNRYYLNHFTVTIHNLPTGYNTIEDFNRFLEHHGFTLNDAGGKMKISSDGALIQSSTVAGLIEAKFASGERYVIPGSYVEFAERKVLPEFAHLPLEQIRREHRREGFEAANADKIFESTYRHQTTKRA